MLAMASGVQSMRLCLRAFRHAPAPQKVGPRIHVARRALSSTPVQWRLAAKKDEADELEEDEEDDDVDPAELEWSIRAALRSSDIDIDASTRMQEQIIGGASAILSTATRVPKINQSKTFWHEDEADSDLITDERNEDEFDEDDIMSMAHGKLEEFREYREYARITAWEMPLLSKLARPFEPPTAQEPLRFRYTSYMGEFHPAENKVVVEFSPRDLPLSEVQQLKLKKLLGPRYNPETDVARMSCEQFEHQAQNKRYLGDLVERLVAQAKDPSDMFEDVPLDLRHHPLKVKPKFPREWRMSEERRKFLDDTRQKSLLLDQAKEEAGSLISGKEKIDQFFSAPAPQAKVPEFIRARLNRPLPKGRPQPQYRRA
ncbi:mitochondrial ribosomal protein [Hypoxylon crocopeplum]|nr:mitochondrial ribosomal protein [Hypoxylon crocopeplum]